MKAVFNGAVAAALAFLTLVGTAGAHPHAWIDLRSIVVFNGDGQVSAIQVEWTFDEFYSTFVLEDIVRTGEDTESALEKVNQENLQGLKAFNYFTEIRANGETVDISDATDSSLKVYKDRLRMVFTIPLDTPVDPRSTLFEYAVFDPSYYIEILHFGKNAITMAEPTAGSCTADLEKPNPDAETISLAASLDQTEIGPNNLGHLFAEVVTVRCAG